MQYLLTEKGRVPISLNELSVGSSLYKKSHGKLPKGSGGWMFDIIDASNDKVIETFSTKGSVPLQQAKKEVMDYVKKKYPDQVKSNMVDIEVSP